MQVHTILEIISNLTSIIQGLTKPGIVAKNFMQHKYNSDKHHKFFIKEALAFWQIKSSLVQSGRMSSCSDLQN